MQYPHEPRISKITLFQEDPQNTKDNPMVAAVSLAYGPIVIRAKLGLGQQGPFLAMPCRRSEKDNGTVEWWKMAVIQDATLEQMFLRLTVDRYRQMASDSRLAQLGACHSSELAMAV